jgi:hypothetical protein
MGVATHDLVGIIRMSARLNCVPYQSQHLVLSVQDLPYFFARRGIKWADADELQKLVNDLRALGPLIVPWGDLPPSVQPHYYRGLWFPEGGSDERT